MGNLPAFCPLEPTSDEGCDMLVGYRDGYFGLPSPGITAAIASC
ncbi:hypothetical protein [Microvirga pudoricolor]|nr:hypothetical protein [Microvirga pudoricolor]